LQLRVNVAVEIPEIFAAMADHRARKRGHRFLGNLDRTGDEKLVMRLH
jgi:hypothetical protein